eukprot:g18176.t1
MPPPRKKQKVLQRRPSEVLQDAKAELKRRLRLTVGNQAECVEEALATLLNRHSMNIDDAFADKQAEELQIIAENGNKIKSRAAAEPKTTNPNKKKKNPLLPKEMQDCLYAKPIMAGYVTFLENTSGDRLEKYEANLFTEVQQVTMDSCEKCAAPASMQAVLKVIHLGKEVPQRFRTLLKACKYQLLANLWNKETAVIKDAYANIRSTICDDEDDEYLQWSGRVADGTTGDEEGPEIPQQGKKKLVAFLKAVNKKKDDMKKSSDSRGTQENLRAVSKEVGGATIGEDIRIPHGCTAADYVTQACAGDWKQSWNIGDVVDDFDVIVGRLKTLETAAENKPTLRGACQKAIEPIERVAQYCKGQIPTTAKPTGLPTQSVLQTLLNKLMTKVDAQRTATISQLLNKAVNAVKAGKQDEAKQVETEVQTMKTLHENLDPQILNGGAALPNKERLTIAFAAMEWVGNPDFKKVALKAAVMRVAPSLQKDPWVLAIKGALFDKMQTKILADLSKAETDCDVKLAETVMTTVAGLMYLDLGRVASLTNRAKAVQKMSKQQDMPAVDDWA